MLPLLIAVALVCLGALASAAAAFSPQPPQDEIEPPPSPEPEPSAFLMKPEPRLHTVDHELLVARLEQYVRRERAAVETFHERPRADLLQSHSQHWVN